MSFPISSASRSRLHPVRGPSMIFMCRISMVEVLQFSRDNVEALLPTPRHPRGEPHHLHLPFQSALAHACLFGPMRALWSSVLRSAQCAWR
jgi:hypothetical protein